MGGTIDYKELIENDTILVIAGPTASGKTEVSIELSKLMDIEVLSADSRQLFKYLNIGTATPTKEELEKVKTHFINIIRPDEYFSAGRFAELGRKKIKSIFKKNKIPCIVGGSGLYIKALCEGLFDYENDVESRKPIIEKLEEDLICRGIDYLYEELKKVDEKSANQYSDKNPRRIIRALEFYRSTGKSLSEAQQEFKQENQYNPIYYAIDYDREILYDRINRRTEIMWKNGLISETKRVLSKGFSKKLNALNTVGYKETIAYLDGIYSEEQAISEIQKNTRRYAKRQLTWFRKNKNIKWLKGSAKEMASEISNDIKNLQLGK